MAWALHTAVGTAATDVHLPVLEAAGLLGISEERGCATLWFEQRPAAVPLAGRWEEIADRDWNALWKAGMGPVRAGRVTVLPPWIPPSPDDDVVCVIDPGMAFGTGHHETTTGCLQALQTLRLAGRRVLDVGTGTGVLAIVALQLGAATAVGIDTDRDAVAAARVNAAANGVSLPVRRGSLEQVNGQRFDVVAANLSSATLVELAAGLAAALAAGGTLIAAGCGLERAATVRAALHDAGLRVRVQPGRHWAVLIGTAPR